LRLYAVGRVEGLLLEIVKARAGKCPEGKVWEVLECLTEEVLLLWAERDQDALLHKTDLH
jgi:hypothetical protein